VSPRKRYTFWIDDQQADGLAAIAARDGILPSEQIRRAIEAWLEAKRRTTTKPARRRASTRRRT
jgi:hypothetical protein